MSDILLIETGEALLQEDGFAILLESQPDSDAYLLEDGVSNIVLEDGSGVLLLEDIPEVEPDAEFGIDTWQFDTPEPVVADRDPITGYLVWQFMDNGAENVPKKISAIRATAKGSDISVQIHAARPGGVIDKENIETGTLARYEATFADSSEVTRYARKKVNIRQLSIWAARYETTWDGVGDRDRLDELIIEGDTHGTKK